MKGIPFPVVRPGIGKTLSDGLINVAHIQLIWLGISVFGIISIIMLEFTYTCTMLRYMCIQEDLWGTDCHHCTCVVMRDCIVLSITPGSPPPPRH